MMRITLRGQPDGAPAPSPARARRIVRALMLAAAVAASPLAPAAIVGAQAQTKAAPVGPLEPLEVATAKGVVVLEVELARTEEQRATGLMFRKSMPERQGMLFDFGADQPVYMWMKNTYIPLDMLFIRSDGVIARIAAMTTPLSTETISSGGAVKAVLELSGGAAAKLGISPGDRIAHPIFTGR